MTSPHVSLGNVESDIGSGTNSLINALNEQKKRQSQIALQAALQGEAQARTTELGSQAQDVAAQAIERQHMNEPAGPGEFGILSHLYPEIKPEIWQQSGITRGQADALTKSGLMITRLNATQSRFDESQMTGILNHFRSNPEVQSATNAATSYKTMKVMFAHPAAITQPSMLLNMANMLATTPNARAIGTELTKLLQGGGLTVTQRAQQLAQKLTTEGDQFTLDPQSLSAIPEVFRGVAKYRMDRYHQLRQGAHDQSVGILGRDIPDNAIGPDPFGEFAAELAGEIVPPLPGGPMSQRVGPVDPNVGYAERLRILQQQQR